MCRCLIGYGVKPELSVYNSSPLTMAMAWHTTLRSSSADDRIDTYRCFFDDIDLVDEFNRLYAFRSMPCFFTNFDELHWLWQKNLELLVGEDLRSNQRIMIHHIWVSPDIQYNFTNYGLHLPDIPMHRDIPSDIQYGRCHILKDMFSACRGALTSYVLGARFLDWLVSLDLNPELFVTSENTDLVDSSFCPTKRIVFERDWEQKWVLGFEWVFDHQAPGYSLISEYTALAVEQDLGWLYWNWPFSENYKLESDAARTARFNRRMAAKERKERARSGKKQPRSRMPGAWKW